MAHKDVTADSVYLCTGQPLPRDIKHMVFSLMNDSFEQAFDCEFPPQNFCLNRSKRPLAFSGISEMQTTRGLALIDIVRGIHVEVIGLLSASLNSIHMFDIHTIFDWADLASQDYTRNDICEASRKSC